MNNEDIIIALASSEARSAIHTIRISGKGCFKIISQIFKGKKPELCDKNSILYGNLEYKGDLIDEVVVSVFKSPASFTKEDTIEISCHGSPFISRKIINILVALGCRPALAGEFTQRAYLNGRFDLAQAESIADLINAESEQGLKIALNQLKGGVSKQIEMLRVSLLDFISLLELELDFAEEDVEFANRIDLLNKLKQNENTVQKLIESFGSGNAIKTGIPIVIAGKPNAGKSTLLNCLLNEERAIVSATPGTTRDTIEEAFSFNGLLFKLIDTAGIRGNADSEIEKIGISRTFEKMEKAEIIFYLIDAHNIDHAIDELENYKKYENKIIPIVNKVDIKSDNIKKINEWVYISAKNADINSLLNRLKEETNKRFIQHDVVISNTRHLHALQESLKSLKNAKEALKTGLSGEIIVFELKTAIENLGTISGKITNEDVLGNIFSKFCIGK